MRAYLEARDGRGCGRCGDPIEPGETASIGHIVALAHGGTDDPRNLRLEHLVCNVDAKADGDRARIVAPPIRVVDVARAVFQSTRSSPGMTRRPWSGARSGTNKRTIVRFRLTAPDRPGGPAYAHANDLRGHRLEPAGIGLFLAGLVTGSLLGPEASLALQAGYDEQLHDPSETLAKWAAWLDRAARG